MEELGEGGRGFGSRWCRTRASSVDLPSSSSSSPPLPPTVDGEGDGGLLLMLYAFPWGGGRGGAQFGFESGSMWAGVAQQPCSPSLHSHLSGQEKLARESSQPLPPFRSSRSSGVSSLRTSRSRFSYSSVAAQMKMNKPTPMITGPANFILSVWVLPRPPAGFGTADT